MSKSAQDDLRESAAAIEEIFRNEDGSINPMAMVPLEKIVKLQQARITLVNSVPMERLTDKEVKSLSKNFKITRLSLAFAHAIMQAMQEKNKWR